MANDSETVYERDEPEVVAPLNPFPVAAKPTAVSTVSSSEREIAEVQAAMVIAKRFPRNEVEAMDRIIQAFTRPTLAEKAQYQYARGGSDISGPSIRAAEAIAQLWGNMQCGVRELEQRPRESTVEAFAWDIQTNMRQVKVFQVPHFRETRKGGYWLEDKRDIYELIANQGARRMRACILGVIPGDVVESAMRQADVTLHTKAEVTPERLASLVEKFGEFGVTKDLIEARIQRRIDAMTPALMVNLGKIYNSLRDGMSAPTDWFEIAPAATNGEAAKTGAAAVKEKLRKQQPLKPMTYPQLMDALNTAVDKDGVDLAESLVDKAIPDPAQRAELHKRAVERRAELAA